MLRFMVPEPSALWVSLSGNSSPAILCGSRVCKVPLRARSRSDNCAAVLRLQNTQPKDRRIYTALTGILADPRPAKNGRGGIAGQRNP